MLQKVIRYGLCALFAMSAIWLFCYGIGLLLDFYGREVPAWAFWALSAEITKLFDHLAPVISIGYLIGLIFESGRARLLCYLAGALLYSAAAVDLISNQKKSREFFALACWINVISLLLRLLSFLILDRSHLLSFWHAIDLLILPCFLYLLGFRFRERAFVRAQNTF